MVMLYGTENLTDLSVEKRRLVIERAADSFNCIKDIADTLDVSLDVVIDAMGVVAKTYENMIYEAGR